MGQAARKGGLHRRRGDFNRVPARADDTAENGTASAPAF